MIRLLLPLFLLIGFSSVYCQCPTSVVAISSSKIQLNFAPSDACPTGDSIGYVAMYVSGYTSYRGYFISSSQLSNTSTTSVTIEDLDNYGQNFTGNTTPWTSSDLVTRIRTEDINFDNCVDCNSSFALPVRLYKFFGKTEQSRTELIWETASEMNSAKFEIEKSINAIDFIHIGEKTASGHADDISEYSFIDQHIQDQPDKVYYRLKQIDLNGEYTYSQIILVQKSYDPYEDILVKYYPDMKAIRVLLSNAEHTNYTIELYNLAGNQLMAASTTADYWETETANFLPGIYLVKVGSSDHSGHTFKKLLIH